MLNAFSVASLSSLTLNIFDLTTEDIVVSHENLAFKFESLISTHVDGYVSEADGAVGDEAGVEGVEVRVALHIGDEGSHANEPDDEDGSDDGGVEALVRPKLLGGAHSIQLDCFLIYHARIQYFTLIIGGI